MEVVDDEKLFEILIKLYPGKIVTRQTFHFRRTDIEQFQIYDNKDTLVKDLLSHYKGRFYHAKDKSKKYFVIEEEIIVIDDSTDIEFHPSQNDEIRAAMAILETMLEIPAAK